MRLEGKIALITGAARGIGAMIADLFVHEGARVVVADILESEAKETARKLSAGREQAIFVRLDVRNQEDWIRAVQTTLDKFHRLDILVNNAGITNRPETIEECTLEQWEQVMAVNATGTFLGIKSVIPAMKLGGGSIINISSIWALVGANHSAAYHASKGAVRALTRAAAIQVARYGIRVNSIYPGTIDTEKSVPPQTQLIQGVRELLLHSPLGSRMLRSLMNRDGHPLEVAFGALYLASNESSYTTGSELVIDGGYTAL